MPGRFFFLSNMPTGCRVVLSFLLIVLCLHPAADVSVRASRGFPSHSLSLWTPPPDFYQVIIDNNLFRPLGWTKPTTAPAFELVATVMKSNNKHKALIRNTRTRKLHNAAVGEALAPGVSITEIARHAVTLNENGTSKVYRLSL